MNGKEWKVRDEWRGMNGEGRMMRDEWWGMSGEGGKRSEVEGVKQEGENVVSWEGVSGIECNFPNNNDGLFDKDTDITQN